MGILATPTQAQKPVKELMLPAFAYKVESVSGTFTDISTNANTVKLGEALAAGDPLRNTIFLATSTTDATPTHKVNTAEDDTCRDACFPLGFNFKVSGKTMTHFVVSAFGGVYFSDSVKRAVVGTNPSGKGALNCFFVAPYLVKKNTATSAALISSTAVTDAKLITKKADQAPAMYLIEGTDGNHILTVQHHYLVRDADNVESDEWIFQFKFYEATGNAEFIVKELQYEKALSTKAGYRHRALVLCFVEAGATTSKLSFPLGDFLGKDYLNVPTYFDEVRNKSLSTQHKFYVGQTGATSKAVGWDSVYMNTNMNDGQMFIDSAHYPEEGRTIRFVYPGECAQTLEPHSAENYTISEPNVTESSFSMNIRYKEEKFPNPKTITTTGTIVAVLSQDETPKYTLANGTWYQKNHLFGDTTGDKFADIVLCNTMPTLTISSYTKPYGYSIKDIAVSNDRLKKASSYYIHLYRMDYTCAGSPIYSDLCHTVSLTTGFDMPQELSAGVPTTNSVAVTAEPATNYAVMLIKSKTQTLSALNGVLKKGDKIGNDAEVLDILTEKSTITINLEANEGCYILAYTVNIDNPEKYFYSPNALDLSIRAAYPSLPGVIDFTKEPYTRPDITSPTYEQTFQSTFRPMPFGWTRTFPVADTLKGSAFGVGKPGEDRHMPTSLYALPAPIWFDAVTPAFVCDKDRILATFNMSPAATVEEGVIGHINYAAGDSVRIEYAVADGEWTTAAVYSDENIPQRNPQGLYPLEATIDEPGLKGKIVRIRYSSSFSTTYQAIYSVDIKEGKLCQTPTAVCGVDSLTTNTALGVTWSDHNYEAFTAMDVFYKPATDTSANAWQKVTSKKPYAVIEDLAANTAYNIYVTATCGRDGSSYESYPATLSTIRNFPYAEDMKQDSNRQEVIEGLTVTVKGDGPFQRGVVAATGALNPTPEGEDAVAPAARLTEVYDDANSWQGGTGFEARQNRALPVSAAVGKMAANAWMLLPDVYVEKYNLNVPLKLSFKACSAQQRQDSVKNDDGTPVLNSDGTAKMKDVWVKGKLPTGTYQASKFYVLVSQNGKFTMKDTLMSLDLSTDTVRDQAFELTLPGLEGRTRVAFYYANPAAPTSALAAEAAKELIFEVYDVKFDYKVKPCFPLTDLERSKTTTGSATFTWKGNAEEYKIIWGTVAGEVYTDTATTTEPTYTLTGLRDFTQYKVKVEGYCDAEHTNMAPTTLETWFMTLQGCHTPQDFQVKDITKNGATFVSTLEDAQIDFVSKRLVYVTPKAGGNKQVFEQTENNLTVKSLKDTTAYVAVTQAVCGTDSSALSEEKPFITLRKARYTVALSALPENGGTVGGAGTYVEDTTITITATPAEGYAFKGWLKGTDTISTTASYSFKVTADVAFAAVFAKSGGATYTVTLNVLPENGGTVSGGGEYAAGTSVTIKAVAANGYAFKGWVKGGDTVSREPSYTFTITEDVAFAAVFAENTATEDLLRAAFNLSTQNGLLYIRNLQGVTIQDVVVYGLSGQKINHFTPNSNEDLVLPVNASKAILFVRIATNKGSVVYKVYMQ